MRLMKLKDLTNHDVFEFSYACNYDSEKFDGHWNESSMFITEDDFYNLSNYIDEVIKDFNYMGPNKVYLEKWIQIKNIIVNSKKSELLKFISIIDNWLNQDSNKSNYFWILGV